MSTVLTCVAQGAAPRRGCGLFLIRQGAFCGRSAQPTATPFTRHPEPSQRFNTSSRTKPKARVRDPPVFYNPFLARGFLASLTSPRWGSCAASSKCSCKQAFLLASDGMTKEGSRRETIPVLSPSSVPSGQLLGGARVSLYNPPFDPPFAQGGQDKS